MFTKDGQTLYLNTWEYNAALILAELAKIIENNGGRVKPAYHAGYIENRAFAECAHKRQMDADRIEELINTGEIEATEKRLDIVKKYREEAAELLKAEEATHAPASHLTYLVFTLDGFYYNVELDDNPFFDFSYCKTPITAKNERSRDAYHMPLDKSWLYDCFLMMNAQKPGINEDRREAANVIFNAVVSAKPCEKAIDKTRRRVKNTYNSGYHYETVSAPERMEKIDF